MANLSIFLEGMLAAMVMGLFGVVIEVVRISDFNLMLLVGKFFITKSQDRPLATSLGWIIHLFIGGAMAEVYFWLVIHLGFIEDFSLLTAVAWSGLLWLITMLAVMPILGAGIFAYKLGRLKWLEQLVVFLAYGFSLYYLMISILI